MFAYVLKIVTERHFYDPLDDGHLTCL